MEGSGCRACGGTDQKICHRGSRARSSRQTRRRGTASCGPLGSHQGASGLGQNVSHAAELATTGGAQGGIIAYSLALSPSVSKLGRFALIPDTWHEPLEQRMVLIKGADETTQAFYRYLQQPAARDVLRRYGLALPGEQ
ncbi:MAG TPA: substrate-binding domain-containing protein [Gammaproteobacteria bacterium]|nr:substrate-binding domain-containing protein [Gammaproteobacteria bacterium]